jgi:hypothetical protein
MKLRRTRLMLEMGRIAGICCFLQALLCPPAAAEGTFPERHPLPRTYFKPYPADGAPIPPGSCGLNSIGRGWLTRDLGQGVNIAVGIAYGEGGEIVATLLFRYSDGKLELSPNEFRLHTFPGGRIHKPGEVRRNVYQSDNERCAQNGEWVYLAFPVRPEHVEQVALVFSEGSVKSMRDIRVRPFRFEKTDDSGSGTSKPARVPIEIGDQPPAEDRLKSCVPSIAIAAAETIVNSPRSWREPLLLFSPAAVLFQHGKKDEAVFWFYAAQLRIRYQLAFEKGDRGQLLDIALINMSPSINNYAFQDVTKLNRILDQVLVWDKIAENPWREKAKPKDVEEQIEKVYSGFRDLKEKLLTEKDDLEQKARLAAPQMERISEQSRTRPCRPGEPDPAFANQTIKREALQVVDFVKNDKDVVRAVGSIKGVGLESYTKKPGELLPSRYIVSVGGDKSGYAVVDVSRTSGDTKFTLACVAHLSLGRRDPFKDVCKQ